MFNPIKKVIHIFKYRTFKNISYLSVGGVIAQSVSLIGAFYIPRILGPEIYGVLSIVASYVALFTVFTFVGLNKVILRECSRNTEQAKQIFESLIGIRTLFSIVAPLISIFCLLFINYELTTKYYVIFFSLTLTISSFSGALNTVYESHEKLKYVAILEILNSIFSVSLAILAVSLGYGVLAILLIRVFCRLLVVIFSYQIIKKRFFTLNFLAKIKWDTQFIKQGVSFSILAVFSTLSSNIDLVMLSFLTTPENVGLYALAHTFVRRGLVFRGSVSTSLFPYYTKKYIVHRPSMHNLSKHTALIVIPLFFVIVPVVLVIEPIITGIVGNAFTASAEIFGVLAFYLIFSYGVIPWGLALQTTNNEKYVIVTVVFTAFLNIFLNLLFFKKYGVIGIAYSTLLVAITNFIMQLAFVKKLVQQKSI